MPDASAQAQRRIAFRTHKGLKLSFHDSRDTKPLAAPNNNSANRSPIAKPDSWHIGSRTLAVAATILLGLGLAATLTRAIVQYQTPGPFTPDRQGLCDFHNGIYFPARAAIAGESPYSESYAANYPVARQIPFFSPVILWLHAPLALLPLHAGEAVNILLQIAILLAIAAVCADAAGFRNRLDVTLSIAAAIVFTRCGHITLFTGYFTFQLVLATYLAVIWADRKPVASAWMLLIVSAKPTYILPLGFLMLARGNYRALTIGATFSIAAAIASLGWIAYHKGNGDLTSGIRIVQEQIVQTQEVHRGMEDESPVHSWTRLDLFAILAKWSGKDPGDLPHLAFMFIILTLPMVALRRIKNGQSDDGIAGLAGALAMTTMLVSLYHQSYDALLLAAPLTGAIAANWNRANSSHAPLTWRCIDARLRFILIALLACPAVNYLSTRFFLTRLDPSPSWASLATSLNGVSLALALTILTWIAWAPGSTAQNNAFND